MTARLGLGIGRSDVRAMIVRDGRAVWRGSRPIDGSQELADVLVDLLGGAPLGRVIKLRVVAALGPALTQVKRLNGLPAVTDRAMASLIVRGNVGRFFLRNGVPLTTTDSYRSNGVWWGAVMETPAVLAVEEACRRLRLRLDGCVPTVAALAQLARDGCVSWRDGALVTSVTMQRGAWVDVRREGPLNVSERVSPALARLSSDSLPFADAYAATCCTLRSPLLLRPSGRYVIRRATLRLALAGSAFLAIGGALLSPGIAASRHLARDTPRLNALRDRNAGSAQMFSELNSATAGLDEISRFTNGRRSMVLLLGALAEALPESSAIVTLRIDSAAGSMTLLSTSAASAIPSLAEVEEILEPRIFGAVTREAIGHAQLQRIAVRFGFPRSVKPSRLGTKVR